MYIFYYLGADATSYDFTFCPSAEYLQGAYNLKLYPPRLSESIWMIPGTYVDAT